MRWNDNENKLKTVQLHDVEPNGAENLEMPQNRLSSNLQSLLHFFPGFRFLDSPVMTRIQRTNSKIVEPIFENKVTKKSIFYTTSEDAKITTTWKNLLEKTVPQRGHAATQRGIRRTIFSCKAMTMHDVTVIGTRWIFKRSI